jgi:hypothetical protein
VRRVCERYVRPGGHVLIGLYHTYGRKPFLDHFREMREHGATEEEMLAGYRALHAQLTDDTHVLSWFRDQVLHPHETQHTLEEMLPVIQAAGMELLSTSINHFQPITSLPELFEQEKEYEELGRQRLRENQYFPGFFVFLARKTEPRRADGDGASMPVPGRLTPEALDTKPYVRHHATFGYHYRPTVRQVLPRPGGGRYEIVTNAQGLRSSREYTPAKPAGVVRLLACGDSMAAGQFVSNEHRFSELLEARRPDLEVVNLALEGSGTDQELLIFEEIGLRYEFDAVLVLPFLQNIRRNMVEAREAIDPQTGRRVLAPKPRFELVGDELMLRNVPVPEERKVLDDPVNGSPLRTDTDLTGSRRLKSWLNQFAPLRALKTALYKVVPWEPFPEYRRSDTPEWQLMAAILRRFKRSAGDKPVVIVPLFYASYVRYRMARNYWERYRSLEGSGVHVLDVLPYFQRLGREAERCFFEPYDCHFSPLGHVVLADALQTELTRLGIIPRGN